MGTKVNSNYEDLLTFTRASKGHALRPVSYGDELVDNGDFSSTDLSNWNSYRGGDLSVESGVLVVEGTGSSFAGVTHNVSTKVNKVYKISLEIASYGTGTGNPRLESPVTSSYVTSTSFTAFEFVFVATSTTTVIRVASGSSGGGNSKFKVDNVTLKEVTFDQPDGTLTLFEHPDNVPRVEWDADRNRLGLLVEEQRINLVTYSENFNFWTKLSAVTVSTTVTNPDGTTDGFLFRPTATAPRIFQQLSSTTADHAHSVYAKAGGKDLVQVGQYNGSTYEMVVVNLNNGDIVASTGTASVTEMPNGWYRISVTGDSISTLRYINISCGDVGDSYSATNINTTADGSSGIYVWGAQLEAGSFPTSYMKSDSGSTATRSADVASIPVADFGYNQSAGTLLVEAQSTSGTTNAMIASLESDTNNRIEARYSSSPNTKTRCEVVSGGVSQARLEVTDSNEVRKISFAFTKDDFASSANGSAVITDTAGTLPSATKIDIGEGTYSNSHINGHIKSIQYYPRRLTNAQLEALTEPRSTPTLSLTFDGLESSYTENYIHG